MFKFPSFVLSALAMVLMTIPQARATSIFINELHYDNSGTDLNEGVEIFAPGNTDLSGWSLLLYNGSDGIYYRDIALSGVVPDLSAGYGVLDFALPSMQNGPDGLALVNAANILVQFISYEGSFLASDGPAAGFSSQDIGVAEGSATSAQWSLHLTGVGQQYEEFGWQAGAASFGMLNLGQSVRPDVAELPAPGTSALFLLGVALLCCSRKTWC